jgi:segregation and condensation protein B
MIKRPFRPIVLLAALVLLAASSPAVAQEAIRIGVMYPLTGPLASQGRPTRDAIKLAFDEAKNVVAGRKVELLQVASGWRFQGSTSVQTYLNRLSPEKPPRYSRAVMETLAIIAYRQPVTRTEIETIRGVSAEAGVNKLLELDLIYIVGRADLPGRPLQYGTTDRFLEFAGMKSIDELPASDVLSSRQIDEWLKNATNAPTPTDADMGLPDEQLPLEAVVAAEAEAGRPIGLVVLTHHHGDHVGGATALAARWGVPIAAHPRRRSRMAPPSAVEARKSGAGPPLPRRPSASRRPVSALPPPVPSC